MKANAVIRIVIWSIVLVILIATLGGVLALRTLRIDRFENERRIEATALPDAQSGRTGRSFQVAAGSITDLQIKWVSGNITILVKDGIDQIFVQEDAAPDSRYVMQCYQSGRTLRIQFSAEPKISLGTDIDLSKDLVIEVPADWICQELDLDVAAANLEVRNLTVREVDFDGASGTCDFIDCAVEDMDMDTASGDVTFSGTLNTLDFDAASASFTGEFQNTPRQIDIDGMSGDLDIALPEDTGFTVRSEGLSSTLRSEFDAVTYANNTHIYGDGRCRIQVDGMSTDVTIRKLDTVIGGTIPEAE